MTAGILLRSVHGDGVFKILIVGLSQLVGALVPLKNKADDFVLLSVVVLLTVILL